MIVEAAREVRAAQVVILVLVIGITILDACGDVVGHHGFRTGTDGVAQSRLAVRAASTRHLGVCSSKTGCAVHQNRVQVIANAATNRAVDALTALQAVASAAVIAAVADDDGEWEGSNGATSLSKPLLSSTKVAGISGTDASSSSSQMAGNW